ncbi:MAG: trypsin-like peptidase domain-containing protein [Longimicrobiales bacterium]|nr:trypsin-like peptidase domain-containing protein [Longimicrobiales bacterium]
MRPDASPPELDPDTTTLEASPPIAIVSHLAGPKRGTTERLCGDRLTLGTAESADLRVERARTARDPDEGDTIFGILLHEGGTYRLLVPGNAAVWVNGERVPDEHPLESGDILELGRGGPVIRFRLRPSGSPAYKSPAEAFSDCLECVRTSDEGWIGRTALLGRGLASEFGTQVSPHFRLGLAVVVLALAGTTGLLAKRSLDLEARFEREITDVRGLAELASRNRGEASDLEGIERLRAELQTVLDSTARRLAQLESRSEVTREAVQRTMASTLFIQGSYRFRDPDSGLPLRHRLGVGGRPVISASGAPSLTLTGRGPVFEVFYTGTAFVVSAEEGLLVSNRHVALPWEFDRAATQLVSGGLEGEMSRIQAWIPGHPDPLELDLVGAAEDDDIALFRTDRLPPGTEALEFTSKSPVPGEEILVIGYPLGIRALAVRAAPDLMRRLAASGDTTFWDVAAALARENAVLPLATRGIVGQVGSQSVVYDAETTHGGSGGPVVTLDGFVVAVNAAIAPDFGGSNLGVPADRVIDLLARYRSATLPDADTPPSRVPECTAAATSATDRSACSSNR